MKFFLTKMFEESLSCSVLFSSKECYCSSLMKLLMTQFRAYISESKSLNAWFLAGNLIMSDEESYGASAHSDYGMITLLATDGVPGLQACSL